MLEEIMNDLKDMTTEQLSEIQRVVRIYKESSLTRQEMRTTLHYYAKFLGINWDENGNTFMELGPFNGNAFSVAQGGALYTLADIAIGYDLLKSLDDDQHVFTLEMKMNFIKKGTGRKLYAKTEYLHRGNRTVVAQCQIVDEEDDIVAHAVGTFYIVKLKK